MNYTEEQFREAASDLEFDSFTAYIEKGGHKTQQFFKEAEIWIFWEDDSMEIEDKKSKAKLDIRLSSIQKIETDVNTIIFISKDAKYTFI